MRGNEMATDQKLTSVFISIKTSLARSIASIVPPREVEDVVQETYVRVCQSSNSSEIKSPRSFMYKTARNIALNYVNQANTRLVRFFDESESVGESPIPGVSADTLERACTDEEFAQFCDAVRRLPKQCRRAFVLRKVYGHSQREIASIMNISEKTVEMHIRNGMKRCQLYLKQEQSAEYAVGGEGV